jgi:hypothetical protein
MPCRHAHIKICSLSPRCPLPRTPQPPALTPLPPAPRSIRRCNSGGKWRLGGWDATTNVAGAHLARKSMPMPMELERSVRAAAVLLPSL